jgi:recombinational DNA repair ATPase RecF
VLGDNAQGKTDRLAAIFVIAVGVLFGTAT